MNSSRGRSQQLSGGGVAAALHGGGFPDAPSTHRSLSARGVPRRGRGDDDLPIKIGAPQSARSSSTAAQRHADPFAAPAPATARPSVDMRAVMQPMPTASIASRLQELREAQLYRSRREEPLGRAPDHARNVPERFDAAKNPTFRGFGIATKKEDTAEAIFANQANASRGESAKAEAIEAARHPVGMSSARVSQPGQRPRCTTFENTSVDPNTARFGRQSERSRSSAADCINPARSGASDAAAACSTTIVPLAVAQHRVTRDSAAGAAGVGLSTLQRLGREVFAGASEFTGDACECVSARAESEAASQALHTARRRHGVADIPAAGVAARPNRDTAASLLSSGVGLKDADTVGRSKRHAGPLKARQRAGPEIDENQVFGVPSVRPGARDIGRLECPRVTDERAFAAEAVSARDLLASRADPVRSQPALTAKRLEREDMAVLVERAARRQAQAVADEPTAQVTHFDEAWQVAVGRDGRTSVAEFLEACSVIEEREARSRKAPPAIDEGSVNAAAGRRSQVAI